MPRRVISANLTRATSADGVQPPVTSSRGGGSPALLGTVLQCIISLVVCGYGELGDSRIQRWQHLAPGLTKSTAAVTFAAAGVREHAGTRLRCTRGPASGCVGLLGAF